ncbi:MAG: hypothetical protein ACTSYJ_09690 [Candidatus Thorarchaeota archaeon]
MFPEVVSTVMAQTPFEFTQFEYWLSITTFLLNTFYAISIRGYLIFILIGFIIYTTTYVDGLAKFLVGAGFFFYFGGPILTNVLAQIATVELVTFESATSVWINFFGMSDADLIYTIVLIGNAVAAICCLTGAILYFTKAAGNLESQGKSLIIRSLILLAVLSYYYVAPYII